MKEKEIELSLEEIRYLIKGTIHWQDIDEKAKCAQRSSTSIRKLGEPFPRKAEETQKIEIKRSSEVERNERFELNKVLLGDRKEIRTHNLEGRHVVVLLTATGLLTLTTWVYFVFAG
ncbi:hypothetical protein [Desulfitobacterium sp.]|uniref:hypothetical protein n=1 Tax=Desulfitobacterium sp. TaxID=49981 RepID=UPI002C5DA5BC|nr:hypothetical protein [Desulfitobacterium sp.]HVJ47572.1 hypothetical protein [Desulfitobacterium sp.]